MTAAIILAGGRALRLDGAAKPLLDIGGRTLLDRAVAAVAECDPVIVVGPPATLAHDVVCTQESPPFGGPVAGIVAGLAHVDSDEIYVLAADLPNAEDAVELLRQHRVLGEDGATPTADGICLADANGRMQWLIGRYRSAALRDAVDALPNGGRDASIRSLLSGLRITVIPAGDVTDDVDTWDDLERARAASQTPRRADGTLDKETT